jgi:hypothetical protein
VLTQCSVDLHACTPWQVKDVVELDVTSKGVTPVEHLSSPDGGGGALGPGHLTDVKIDWLDELQRFSNFYLTLRVSPDATQVREPQQDILSLFKFFYLFGD